MQNYISAYINNKHITVLTRDVESNKSYFIDEETDQTSVCGNIFESLPESDSYTFSLTKSLEYSHVTVIGRIHRDTLILQLDIGESNQEIGALVINGLANSKAALDIIREVLNKNGQGIEKMFSR